MSDDRIYTVQPSIYRGTVFRSRLEAECAKMLDALGLGWAYEPRRFELGGGVSYLPDFWVDELCLWIECRGYDNEKGRTQVERFCKYLATAGRGAHGPRSTAKESRRQTRSAAEFLLIRPDCAAMLLDHDFGADEAQCWTCATCGKGFFLTLAGFYACKACGEYAKWRQHIPFRGEEPEVAPLRLGRGWRPMSVSRNEWELHCARAWRDHYAEQAQALSKRLAELHFHPETEVSDAAARGEYGQEVAQIFAGWQERFDRAWSTITRQRDEARVNLLNAEEYLSSLEARARSR